LITIKYICNIGLVYKKTGNRNVNLLKDAVDLLNIIRVFNITDFIEVIKENYEYIDSWLLWSMDKRWSPAWYFSEDNNEYIVGYYNSQHIDKNTIKFNDKTQACAYFIIKEIEDYKNIIEKRK
jgi:hypothetical protein